MTKQYDIFDQQGYKVGTAQERSPGWADIYVPGEGQPVGGIRGELKAESYEIKAHSEGIKIGEVREHHDPFISYVDDNSEWIGILGMIVLGIAAVVAVIWGIVWGVNQLLIVMFSNFITVILSGLIVGIVASRLMKSRKNLLIDPGFGVLAGLILLFAGTGSESHNWWRLIALCATTFIIIGLTWPFLEDEGYA